MTLQAAYTHSHLSFYVAVWSGCNGAAQAEMQSYVHMVMCSPKDWDLCGLLSGSHIHWVGDADAQ